MKVVMQNADSPKLERLYTFFNTFGRERMDGLDRSYFRDLSPAERAEAWDFLTEGFADSVDKINGLYLLDKMRAIGEFKIALDEQAAESACAANQINRLLMLRYVTNADVDPRYIGMLADFARDQSEDVRVQFAQSLSVRNATTDNVNALKDMILAETERLPLATAILALMNLHGVAYDPNDPEQRWIYMALRSSATDDKLAGMRRLNAIQPLMES